MPMFNIATGIATTDNIPQLPIVGFGGSSFWGRGIDGDLTLSGSGTEFDITSAPPAAAPGAPSRTNYAQARAVISISGTAIGVSDSANFFAGDSVVIINLRGSTGATANVGNWERAEVASVGTGVINLTSALKRVYGNATNADLTGQSVVIQRIPEYRNITFVGGSGARAIYAPAWDGTTGGILALCAQSVTATGPGPNVIGRSTTPGSAGFLGYRGGSGGVGGAGGTGAGTVSGGNSGQSTQDGQAGESYTGVGSNSRPANAGGGGGGNGNGGSLGPDGKGTGGGAQAGGGLPGGGGAGGCGANAGGGGAHRTQGVASPNLTGRAGAGGGSSGPSGNGSPGATGAAMTGPPSQPSGSGGGAGGAGGGGPGGGSSIPGTTAPLGLTYGTADLTSKIFMGSGGGGAAGGRGGGQGGSFNGSVGSSGGGGGGGGGGVQPGGSAQAGSNGVTGSSSPPIGSPGGPGGYGGDGAPGGAGGGIVLAYIKYLDDVIFSASGSQGTAGGPGGAGGSGISGGSSLAGGGGGGGGGGMGGGAGAGGAYLVFASQINNFNAGTTVAGGPSAPGGPGGAGGAGAPGSSGARTSGAGGAGNPGVPGSSGGTGWEAVRFLQKLGTGATYAFLSPDGTTFAPGAGFPTTAYKYSF